MFDYGISRKNELFVTDDMDAGFANQLLFFQGTLKIILEKYSNYTFLIQGPKSDHIFNSYGTNTFFDFFKLRKIHECESYIKSIKRKSLCKKYINLISKAKDKYSLADFKKSIKIVSKYKIPFCMPWVLKSDLTRERHCRYKKIENLPFFFEIFDFKDEIKIIGNNYMNFSNLIEKQFATIHFRSGDFKIRKEFKYNATFAKHICPDFDQLYMFSAKKIKKTDKKTEKIFVMAENSNEITQSVSYISKKWLFDKISLSFPKYITSIEFIKILIEIYISSNSREIIGNHFSTLSEVIISYALMKNNNLKYYFYEFYDSKNLKSSNRSSKFNKSSRS